MIRRLLDRILPDEAFSGIGRVNWRLLDEPSRPNPTAVTMDGGICAPTAGAWDPLRAGAPSNWRRWPGVLDLLPAFSAPRGAVRFGQYAEPLPWSDPRSDPLGDVLRWGRR